MDDPGLRSRKRVAFRDGDVDDDAPPATSRRLTADDIQGQEEQLGPEFEDGIRIEPFNLRQEMQEGHFDADGNYVERNMERESRDLADAWLDEYDEKHQSGKIEIYAGKHEQADDFDAPAPVFDAAALRTELLTFLKRDETVAQALRRLRPTKQHAGQAKARASQKQQQQHQQKQKQVADTGDEAAFNRLTEIADQLVQTGDVGIYDSTADTIRFTQQKEESKNSAWEYRWSADGPVYGPFAATEMQGWANGGFFNNGAVEVRRAGTEDAFVSWNQVSFLE